MDKDIHVDPYVPTKGDIEATHRLLEYTRDLLMDRMPRPEQYKQDDIVEVIDNILEATAGKPDDTRAAAYVAVAYATLALELDYFGELAVNA